MSRRCVVMQRPRSILELFWTLLSDWSFNMIHMKCYTRTYKFSYRHLSIWSNNVSNSCHHFHVNGRPARESSSMASRHPINVSCRSNDLDLLIALFSNYICFFFYSFQKFQSLIYRVLRKIKYKHAGRVYSTRQNENIWLQRIAVHY